MSIETCMSESLEIWEKLSDQQMAQKMNGNNSQMSSKNKSGRSKIFKYF